MAFSRLRDVIARSQLALFEPHPAELELIYPPEGFVNGIPRARIPYWSRKMRARYLCSRIKSYRAGAVNEVELFPVEARPGDSADYIHPAAGVSVRFLVGVPPERKPFFEEGKHFFLEFSEAPPMPAEPGEKPLAKSA
jgi:hypothetical protein